VAKEDENVRIIKGSRRSEFARDYRRSPAQALCPIQSEAAPYVNLRAPGMDMLIGAFNAMQQRVEGLIQDRSRIGRDLHDSVLQSLYAIGLSLGAASSTAPLHPQNAQRLQDHVVAQLNHLIQEVRAMIASLNSGTIREFHLSAELASLQQIYEQAASLRIELDLQPKAIDTLTNEEEEEIVNIVREALSNCARHANATRVAVALRLEGKTVRLDIVDNGDGFALTGNPRRGYGLANMESRARKLGGTLHVHPTIGGGTTVAIAFTVLARPIEP